MSPLVAHLASFLKDPPAPSNTMKWDQAFSTKVRRQIEAPQPLSVPVMLDSVVEDVHPRHRGGGQHACL